MASERVTLTIVDPDGEREVALSSPNKAVWPGPGITKAELVEYFQIVSTPFLEANGNRPVSLERFRNGVGPSTGSGTQGGSSGTQGGGSGTLGGEFLSKNPPAGTPDYVDAVMVTYNSGRQHPQIVLNRPSAIV